jgi:hypothetical protein
MRQGIAKTRHHLIAYVLIHRAAKPLNHLSTGAMVNPHHLLHVFGVEVAHETSRVHQVTEQHGEVAAFSLAWW